MVRLTMRTLLEYFFCLFSQLGLVYSTDRPLTQLGPSFFRVCWFAPIDVAVGRKVPTIKIPEPSLVFLICESTHPAFVFGRPPGSDDLRGSSSQYYPDSNSDSLNVFTILFAHKGDTIIETLSLIVSLPLTGTDLPVANFSEHVLPTPTDVSGSPLQGLRLRTWRLCRRGSPRGHRGCGRLRLRWGRRDEIRTGGRRRPLRGRSLRRKRR
jgi:hypothetical protein